MPKRVGQYTGASIIFLLHAQASAHELAADGKPHDLHQLLRTWEFEPVVVSCLIATALLYSRGIWQFWRGRALTGAGIKQWEVMCFAGGWLAVCLALVSPLHSWGSVLFAAHMVQHEILMLIAAPLIVLGRPVEAFLKALPGGMAHTLARGFHRPQWLQMWRLLSSTFVAWAVHAIVLWLWHMPRLFEATLRNEFVHGLQHSSFFGSAVLFWWAVVRRNRAISYGTAVLYMFTTAMHTGLLGAMITLARHIWYPAYIVTAPDWGLTPLEDQQLGGLIMWIPAGLVYVVAGLLFMLGWLRESERRVIQWQTRTNSAFS